VAPPPRRTLFALEPTLGHRTAGHIGEILRDHRPNLHEMTVGVDDRVVESLSNARDVAAGSELSRHSVDLSLEAG
jgi:hypothetical protein